MIGGVLGMGRRMAVSRMTDQCRVTRPGPEVWDEAAGQHVNVPVVVYTGPCRIKQPSTAATDAEAGSQLITVNHVHLHLPVSAVGVQVGDTAEIVASPTRPVQAGRKFRIVESFDGSQTTALRFRVEATDGR